MQRVLWLTFAALILQAAHGQSWPTRPLRFIVPFPPGGSTDVAARALAVVKSLAFDTLRDFVPITQVATQPIALAVHASVPAQNVRELIAYAKANPGKLSFCHSGTGSGQHFSGGGGPAVRDLVAGQVPVGVLGSTPLIPHHKAGRIRILAFT